MSTASSSGAGIKPEAVEPASLHGSPMQGPSVTAPFAFFFGGALSAIAVLSFWREHGASGIRAEDEGRPRRCFFIFHRLTATPVSAFLQSPISDGRGTLPPRSGDGPLTDTEQ